MSDLLPSEVDPVIGSAYLAVNFNNETNCQFPDDKIYLQFIARNMNEGNRFVTITGITTDAHGHSVANIGLPSSYSGMIPAYTLADFKQNGSFYLKTAGTIAGARFYISLGAPLTSFQFLNSFAFKEPVETSPWDIFEFGYDPKRIQAFGFNTSQVAFFSIPLWFSIAPEYPIASNPKLPLGIKLRDSKSPEILPSQSSIIENYDHFIKEENAPTVFTLNYLKSTDPRNPNYIRINSPSASPVPPVDQNYLIEVYKIF